MMKRKIALFLTFGMLLAAGCCGTPDAGVEQNAGGIGKKEETTGEKKEETVSADNGDRNMEENVDSEQEMKTEDSSYTWQEITITLPKEWEDSCVIVDGESGFSIFQKASYEENNLSGFICGFDRATEFVEYGIGETMIAFTDDGLLYYLIQPLDVDCNTENEEIAGEYIRMCGQVPRVKASVQIAGSGVHKNSDEYELPTSSIFPLEEEMLACMSDNDLWIAKNEIYARHGRQFVNEYLQQYFNRCTWYEGTIPPEEFQDSVLSELEKDNIKLLEATLKEYENQHPYPKKYQASETALEDLSGDGSADEISYQVTDGENGEYQCEITVNGKTYLANELNYMTNPLVDCFYITDILEGDGMLEIAVLDEGPSEDLNTYFYQYDGTLSYFGQVPGFPFAEMNNGYNGFNGYGGIIGRTRTDLIETAYLQEYWWYDRSIDWIVYQNQGWADFIPVRGHILYEDLPVHYEKDENSDITMIPAQEEVFFLSSDKYQWILVKGKDGSQGYMLVEDGNVVDLNKPADQIFSGLYFFD